MSRSFGLPPGGGGDVTQEELDAVADGKVDVGALALNAADYGTTGDGTTNDTAALQAALDAVAASGGVLILPPGTYESGALDLTDANGVHVVGYGATIAWSGAATSVPTDYIGLALAGTCSNVTVEGLRFQGSGTIADGHAGVYTAQNATLTGVTVANCAGDDLSVGVHIGHAVTSTVTGATVTGCRLDTLVGTGSGHGYGIVSSGATDTRIIGNSVVGARRHSIYVSAGSRVVVANNTIHNHRQSVTDGSLKSAIVLARTSDIVCTGNTIIDGWDGGIEVTPDTGTPVRNVLVANNVIVNPHGPAAIWLASDINPPTGLVFDHIDVRGNSIRVAAGVNIDAIRLRWGKNVTIAGNSVNFEQASTEVHAVEIRTLGETAGTATYSGGIVVEHNQTTGAVTGAGAILPIAFGADAAASAVDMRFVGNSRPGTLTGNFFAAGANLTNPKVTIGHQPSTGITLSGVSLAQLESPSPQAVVPVGHSDTFWEREASLVMYTQAHIKSERNIFASFGAGTESSIGATWKAFNQAGITARRSIGAAATDAASTQTLANNIRTLLIDIGWAQT